MIQSRIREIRKSKGLTLQQVGDRAGTTAQTIGRLETGMRKLSVDWIRTIATALEVDPAELLSLPESGDIPIDLEITLKNGISEKAIGVLALRVAAQNPEALRISQNIGAYLKGDTLVFEDKGSENLEKALGNDCLVTFTDGTRHFAKVAEIDGQNIILAPLVARGPIIKGNAKTAAPLVTLVRNFVY
jgi:transcriptional regulator with XRE-family HTH domain